ncbi:MAG: phage minor head protein [Pseudomonadota bacterium]|nr:phage minor head protein [Pseudomonadota bacterium]
MQFKEAINHFKKKASITTASWDELKGLIHAKAFTVAGATQIDLLKDLQNAVSFAIQNGETITQFRKRFDEIVSKHGWSYKGKRGWRSSIIYQTNKNTARAAGRFEQQQRAKAHRPYLMYSTAGDSKVRPEHQTWNYVLLPIDHVFWQTHYPPNDYGCRCKAISKSSRDIKREGLKFTDPKTLDRDLTLVDHINANTGEVSKVYPGVGLGWDYNPGMAWLGGDYKIGKEIPSLGNTQQSKIINALNAGYQKALPVFKSGINEKAAEHAIGKLSTSANKYALGHLDTSNLLKLSSYKGIGTTLVTINDDVITKAVGQVSIDKLYYIMELVQSASPSKINGDLLTITKSGLIITIKLGKEENQIIRVTTV